MRPATTTLLATLFVLSGVAVDTALASGPNATRMLIEPDGRMAYFSPRLGAQFTVQQIRMGGYYFTATRIVSQPVYGSPLNQLGLNIGDVITRLDGIPVTNTRELERHILQTKVRFIKAGSSYVQKGWMYINQNRFFHDTYYPPFNPWSGGGWSGGMRP